MTTTSWRREHAIPVRSADLIRRLTDDPQLAAAEREPIGKFCKLLAATFHYEYHAWIEALEELYAPFDPDSSTAVLQASTEAERAALVPELFGKFAALLERANYQRLSQEEIELAVEAASDWGVRLQVNFAVFQQLEVYARGCVVERRTRRLWQHWYRPEAVDVPLYQRLVVIFRLREHRDLHGEIDVKPVYLKLFKNIPRQDIDMLLPATRFRLTLLDRGKIILPMLSGIAIAVYRIIQGALMVAVAGLYGVLALLGLVGGTVGYGVKSFLGYLRTKERYQLSLTRSLYFQNLDNNAGVFYRLLDEAEEQEVLEAVLAYALLRRRAGSDGWTQQQLDREAEAYLQELLGRDVDFEVGDALAKLARLDCATQDAAGRWHAVSLGEAISRLDQRWDDYFQPPSSARGNEMGIFPASDDARPVDVADTTPGLRPKGSRAESGGDG